MFLFIYKPKEKAHLAYFIFSTKCAKFYYNNFDRKNSTLKKYFYFCNLFLVSEDIAEALVWLNSEKTDTFCHLIT